MRRILHRLASRSVLAVAVLLVGAMIWLGLGIVNINFAPLAKAGGCGHFCGISVVDACADPNPYAGSGPVASSLCGGGAGCPAGQQCYYCCIGCAPPPGAPPGADGCWSPPSDTTPPVTTYSLSGPIGANGWYVGSVQVTLSATDPSTGSGQAGSGVAATYLDGTPYTGPRTYSAQGTTGFSFYSRDNAGNTESTKWGSFRVDTVVPSVSQSAAGAAGLAGWYVGPVQLTLSASDATSGIWSTTLDGAAYAGPKTYSAQGANPFSYFARDNAGNTSATQSGTFWIDTAAPTISSALAGTLGLNGWYVSPVQVTLSGSDATSGIGSLTLDGSAYIGPRTYSAQGTTNFNYFGRDVAGNTSATQSGSFSIDSVAPAITGARSPAANAYGWNSTDVTVTFTCVDATAGVSSCTSPQTVTAEGAGQSRSGTAVDAAGNSASATVSGVSIDRTAPAISGSRSPAANASGWNNTDVTVTFACSDALSGVAACTSPQTVTAEGANQSRSGTAADRAGNTASSTVSGISIDRTAPIVTASLSTPPNADGWHNADVTVSFACSDSLSGVQTCVPLAMVSAEGAAQSVSGSSTDRAGNTASTSRTINLDKTAPTLTWGASPSAPDGTNGWYVSPVTVDFICSDALSGVRVCPTPTALSSDGSAQSVARTIFDYADNPASTTAGTFDIDLTPPSLVSSMSPAAPDGAGGWYVTVPTITFACSDATSGVGSCPPPVTLGDGVGQSVTRAASDRAGLTTGVVVGPFSVDTTAPMATASVTGTLGSNGWYLSPVTVVVTGTDATSGLAGLTLDGAAYTAPRTYGAEGTNTFTYSAHDEAGNIGATQTSLFRIDTIAPATSVNLTGIAGANGWYAGPVLVTLSASDATSGVDQILLDGTPYTSTRLYLDGTRTITVQARDRAGNVEPLRTVAFNVDHVPPVTTASITGEASDGWYRSDVTIRLSAADAHSGVNRIVVNGEAREASALVTLAEEGEHRVEFYAVDNAGNTEGLQALVIRIDRTPPQVAVNTARLPDGNLRLDVTAHDALSGVRGGVVAIMRESPEGRIVRHWNFDGETFSVEWDGLDENGQPVSDFFIWASASDRAVNESTTSSLAPAAIEPTATSTATLVSRIRATRTPADAPTGTPPATSTGTATSVPSPTATTVAPTTTPTALLPTPTPARAITIHRKTAQVKPPTAPLWPWLLATLMPALGLAFFAVAVLDPRPRALRRLARLAQRATHDD